MRVYKRRPDIKTKLEYERERVAHYIGQGLGYADVRFELKRNYGISLSLNAVRSLARTAPSDRR